MSTRFSGVLNKTRSLPAEPEPAPTPSPRPVTQEPPQRVGRPRGKKSNPEYRQVTVYLRESVHRAAQKLLLDDERKEFSELVDELVSRWVQSRSPKV